MGNDADSGEHDSQWGDGEPARERERYEAIINSSRDMATIIDSDGTIVYVSPAVEDVLGYDPEELTGENGYQYQPQETTEAVEGTIQHVIEHPNESRTVETRFRRADGSWAWIESSIQNKLDDERIEGLLVTSRDITERKEYERELKEQRDTLEILNQVLRHDVRNDLQLVTAYGGLLLDACETDEAEEHITTIVESAEHAVELTETAREIADVLLSDSADTRPMDLEPVLETEISEVQSSYPEAAITYERPIPSVRITANEMLSSVFNNLLKNAIQHNDKDVAEVTVSATEQDETVAVRIADNGPGIPDDQKETIFGKGETGLDSAGTGMGLYLVDTLVTKYDGEVWVEDNDPDGSVFVVELPITE